MDLGLQQAGFRSVLGVDNDETCARSYAANFPGVPFFDGSIADLDEKKFVDLLGAIPEQLSLLAGGPPCPPYSKSRFYRKDKPRALADPLSEVTIAGYLSCLKLLKPRAFLFENVAGFAYDVHRDAFNQLIETAQAEGYECSWAVLNAADYGVPQIRERLFVVGTKAGRFEFPAPTNHDPKKSRGLFDAELPRWVTAGDALSDLDTDDNASDEGHFAGGKHHELLEQIPPGENYLFFTEKRGHPAPLFKWRSRYWSFLLKLSPELPSWTIQARRSNNMGPFHWRNRILRIDEVKRLQTFPDDWCLEGSIERQWRQVGNAVPPQLARALGEQLLAHLAAEPVPEVSVVGKA